MIILNVAGRVVGVVVDSVSDVLMLAADTIRPTPEFSSATFDTRYITGLGSVDGLMLILLDIEKLMTGADMALVETKVHRIPHQREPEAFAGRLSRRRDLSIPSPHFSQGASS